MALVKGAHVLVLLLHVLILKNFVLDMLSLVFVEYLALWVLAYILELFNG